MCDTEHFSVGWRLCPEWPPLGLVYVIVFVSLETQQRGRSTIWVKRTYQDGGVSELFLKVNMNYHPGYST